MSRVIPYPGPATAGREVLAARRDHPLDLEGCQHLQALGGQGVGLASQQQAAAERVRLPVLPVAVARRPGPTRLRRQGDDPRQIRNDPKITDGCPTVGWRGQPVVEPEVVEAGRGANAPRRELRQPVQRHRLDPGDARVVDEGGGHGHDAGLGEAGQQALRLGLAGFTLDSVHESRIGHR